jgi:hypothetical protein
MLNLRSSPSGTPFVGEAAGDVVQWDDVEKKFFVGQLARPSCSVVLSVPPGPGQNASFSGGDPDELNPLASAPAFILQSSSHFELAGVGGVQYTGPTIAAVVTFVGTFTFGVSDAGQGAIGIAQNADLNGISYAAQAAVRAGVMSADLPALAGPMAFVLVARRRVALASGDVIAPVGAISAGISAMDMRSYSLTVEG